MKKTRLLRYILVSILQYYWYFMAYIIIFQKKTMKIIINFYFKNPKLIITELNI